MHISTSVKEGFELVLFEKSNFVTLYITNKFASKFPNYVKENCLPKVYNNMYFSANKYNKMLSLKG